MMPPFNSLDSWAEVVTPYNDSIIAEFLKVYSLFIYL